jgi:shikimate dehydrogenase
MSAPFQLGASLSRIPSPTGATRLFAVIGHPVEQVQAPVLMNQLFLDRGVDAVLVPISASPLDLPDVVEGLKRIANLDGMLITVPHKFAICRHVSNHSDIVSLSLSANAIRREENGGWSAANFDGTGFVAGLKRAGHDPVGKTISLVGAGGAGASIAPALLMSGAGLVNVSDISSERARTLCERLASRWRDRVRVPNDQARFDSDIVINATPLGLRPEDPLPFEVEGLRPSAVVADIIMKPAETRLLKAAAGRGLMTHPGIHMLTEQIEFYRQYFRIP